MTNEAKISKIQTNFKSLSEVASSLNAASNKLTKTVALLDETLKKLNIGLTVWVSFRFRDYENASERHDTDQIGYCKVNGVWGIALRRIWGDESRDEYNEDGPWLFNDASRDLRIHGVDKIPEVVEELAKAALSTQKKIEEKTLEVLGLAAAISPVANETKGVGPNFYTGAMMQLRELAGSGNQVAPAMRRPAPKPASLPLQPTMPSKPVSAPLEPTMGNTEGKK